MIDNRPYIYDVPQTDLHQFFKAKSLPRFRYQQLQSWLNKGVTSVADLRNMPKDIQHQLAEVYRFDGLVLINKHVSAADDTVKYVGRLADGHLIECVYMTYESGTSVCVSSQSGCRMGCQFCASTGIGFGRNLTSGELLAQVLLVGKDRAKRIDHITVMGIGEPLENLSAVLGFINRANDPDGLNIGLRKITVSTCGLVPEISALAEAGLPITLAISLHAPNDNLRSQLMPINRRYPIDQLMAVCKAYQRQTNRRMTYEYAMFKNVNDQPRHAIELAALLKGQLCHVNLIPANETSASPYQASTGHVIKQFQQYIQNQGIPCTVHRSLGQDIAAACGQLRRIQDGQNWTD